MAPSVSNDDAANKMPVLDLKRDTFAASTDYRIMLEEFGRKYYTLGYDAGLATGLEAGLTEAKEEVEVRIASATEESQKCIDDLLQKGHDEAKVDVNLANEARDVISSVVSAVDDMIQLPGIPTDTYTALRERCEYLSGIRNKFSKRLGREGSSVHRTKRRSESDTPSKKIKREKTN
ncbi:hypothetical protein ACHAPU_010324 [Fusarium lateritium]